VGKPIS